MIRKAAIHFNEITEVRERRVAFIPGVPPDYSDYRANDETINSRILPLRRKTREESCFGFYLDYGTNSRLKVISEFLLYKVAGILLEWTFPQVQSPIQDIDPLFGDTIRIKFMHGSLFAGLPHFLGEFRVARQV